MRFTSMAPRRRSRAPRSCAGPCVTCSATAATSRRGAASLRASPSCARRLHSGLPISVVDLERARGPLRIGIAGAGESYVFNASGQTIDIEGLLNLFDADGPCANAVKDAQRTKTHMGTRATLSVVWGVVGHEAQVERAVAWYRELLERAGAATAAD
jgi:DNA/RNA-binding domain of Phe-tRNA-synthetase-like protein